MTMRRVRVISEGGRLVGVFAPSPGQSGSEGRGPVAQLRAGPNQQEHELEIEWPTGLAAAAMTEALHARAKVALRLR